MFRNTRRRTLWNIPFKITGTLPSARWGHTTTYIEDLNGSRYLFVFGGWDGKTTLNDSYYYNIDERVWSTISSSGSSGEIPKVRSGHTINSIPNSIEKNKLILIGGDGNYYLRKIWLFDMSVNKWEKIIISSSNKVYIKDDLLVNERLITKITEEGKNNNKNGKNGVNHDVYLGKTAVEVVDHGFGTPSKDVYINDKIRAKEKMVYPSTRSRHTCTLVGEKVFMFGGGGSVNGEKRVFNDLWILDLILREWQKPKTIGRVDSIWGHSATLIGKYIYIFGGCHYTETVGELLRLNTETYEWDHINMNSNIVPAPRAAHTCILYDNLLVILWGGNNNVFSNDICIIDTDVYVCKRLIFKSPHGRCAHTAVAVDSMMYVLGGGRDSKKRYKELYAVDLEYAIQRSEIREIAKKKRIELEILRKQFPEEVNSESKKKENNDHPPPPPLLETKLTEEKKGNNQIYMQFMPINTEVKVDDDKKKTQRKSRKSFTKKSNKSKNIEKRMEKFREPKNTMIVEDSMPISLWLTSINLKKYTRIFIDNEIDMNTLCYLNEQDLVNMGITKIGPRKILLQAIDNRKNSLQTGKQRNTNDKIDQTTESILNLTESFKELRDEIKNLCMLIGRNQNQFVKPQPQRGYYQTPHSQYPHTYNPYIYHQQAPSSPSRHNIQRNMETNNKNNM